MEKERKVTIMDIIPAKINYTEPYDGLVYILGTQYNIKLIPEADDPILKIFEGYTDQTAKKIVVKLIEKKSDSVQNLADYVKNIMRHELIHAFLFESGLGSCANEIDCWSQNEKMVDWFAYQSPKIFKLFQQLNCL